jgi:hypothetical protein
MRLAPQPLRTAVLVGGALGLAQLAAAQVENPERAPAQRRIEFVEAWRSDPDSDEYLIGYVGAAVRGDDGSIYLLDAQQQEVLRFRADGKYLGTIVRRGEGPGEIDQTFSMAWWSPGTLLLPQSFPPRVVRVAADGGPLEELRVLRAEGDESPAAVGHLQSCGEYAVVSGHLFMMSLEKPYSEQWLGVIDADGKVHHVFDAKSLPMSTNFLEQTFDELGEFWSWSRWALSADGRLFVAPERERYRIDEYDLQGKFVTSWTRPTRARKRTDADRERLRGSRTFLFNGQKAKVDYKLSDLEPPIRELAVYGDRLWVKLDAAAADGVYARFAVHDLDGTLLEELDLALPYDAANDMVFQLDADSFVLVKNGLGAQQAHFAGFGAEAEADLAPEPVEVVLLRAKG